MDPVPLPTSKEADQAAKPRLREPATPSPVVHLTTLKHISVNAAMGWVEHRASSRGAALALYTLFSLAPVLYLVTTFADLFFGAPAVRTALVAQVRLMVGDDAGKAVQSLLSTTQQHFTGSIVTWISFGILLVSATTAFAELKDSLDEMWELPPSTGNSIWIWIRERVLSLGILVVLAALLLASLAVSAVLASLDKVGDAYWKQSGAAEVATIATEVIGFAVIVALFAAIYKLLPNTPIKWRDVFPGALLTAVLFTLGKGLIAYYLSHGGVSTAFGAAASFVALILWVYYSAQIFFFGALWTYYWTFTLGSRRGVPRKKAHLEYVEVTPTPTELEDSGLPPAGGSSRV